MNKVDLAKIFKIEIHSAYFQRTLLNTFFHVRLIKYFVPVGFRSNNLHLLYFELVSL
jgi:hypothetical protein